MPRHGGLGSIWIQPVLTLFTVLSDSSLSYTGSVQPNFLQYPAYHKLIWPTPLAEFIVPFQFGIILKYVYSPFLSTAGDDKYYNYWN